MAWAQYQPFRSLSTAEIKHKIDKLEVLGSVMYIAAHPDDENTRLIAYLAQGKKYETTYLSLTRGDGGQNLIGKEVREELGMIRTQELLAARRTDGGSQMFSRANDFGYSKHPDETLNIWEKEEILADVVWAIRKFQPDVIITRFSPNSAGRTHGHHTTSALLAQEAFTAAADPKQYPEQLKYVEAWETKRIFWNTSPWFFRAAKKEFKAEDYLPIPVGEFDPILGKSYGEIASTSRSQHRSQGFGSAMQRGTNTEYLELLDGKSAFADIMDNIDISWERIEGGKKVASKIKKLKDDYNISAPEKSIPALEEILSDLRALDQQNVWVNRKELEVEELLLQCAGLWVEANSPVYSVAAGDSLKIEASFTPRAKGVKVEIDEIAFGTFKPYTSDTVLIENRTQTFETTVLIPESHNTTQPYWLTEKADLGMYKVENQLLRGLPENLPAITVSAKLKINDTEIIVKRPVLYKWVDPAYGEKYRPLAITPPVALTMEKEVFFFPSEEGKTVKIKVKSLQKELKANIALSAPKGWTVKPAYQAVDIKGTYNEKWLNFTLTPPSESSEGELGVIAEMNGKVYETDMKTIEYEHIPVLVHFPQSKAKVVHLDAQIPQKSIAYIMGAGDKVPETLREIGYKVDELDNSELRAEVLRKYDVVMVGIRAYNTNEQLKFAQSALMEFVKDGGHMIVQYNTSHRLKTKELAPYALQLSRDRVTVEEAPVTFLAPEHPVLNYPNKITAVDFENWVQERGLYFPNKWDENFTPILSMNDPGETPKEGSLLVTTYGQGSYIYSGISWFRELPAGVSGAIRLFINMISFEASVDTENKNLK
ncbi:GlcNAc-PI de-N-acetylase [Sediminitomix flava]|uniref:GlcNAc-PI de-N-acetylase n=2 Tax=Sediminitomix flava TaxID=379075 RepID=A0A315Z9D4_SEDFL|nr:GlcNAc-PI de-N-acetylase [Sediminitomix flava]